MRHEFHPDAYAEYEEAARYYAERDPELAARFIAAVEEAIERICDSPGRWRLIDEDVRRCLTHVFPYAVQFGPPVDEFSMIAARLFRIIRSQAARGMW